MRNFIRTGLSILFLLSTFRAAAEGTNPISPNTNNMSALLVAYDLGSGAYLNCPEDNRIYFDIKNHQTENLYFGFDWRQYTSSGGNSPRLKNLYYRIRRPDGTVALGPVLWNPSDISIGSGGTGVINGYNQAVNGPNIGSVSNGYTPIVFNPDQNGSYWFEFYRSNDGGLSMITTGSTGSNGNRAIAPLFDITVADNSSFVVYKGRLHSDKWAFLACEPGTYRNITHASASPVYYAYTTDSTIVKVKIEPGFEPIAYNFAVNNYGVTPITPNNPFTSSRNSTYNATAPSLLNGYKVFLNMPDTTLYKPGIVPTAPQLLSPAITGCGPYEIHFSINSPGDVKILINLNGVPGYQEGTADRMLEASGLPAGNNVMIWDGLDGNGTAVTPGTTIRLTSTILKGRFNVPLYDAEVNSGGLSIDIMLPIFGRPERVFWNDSFLSNVGNNCDNSDNSQQNNVTGSGLDNSRDGVTSMPTRAWNGNGNTGGVLPAPSLNGNDMDERQCNDFGNVRTLNLWAWGVTIYSSETEASFGCPTNGPLPIRLLDFAAIKNAEAADLKWITSQEINSSHFEVERSADGRGFQTIGAEEASGNSNTNKSYAYTDVKPLQGMNYYRLKMVDLDGSFVYSQVRMLKFDQEAKLDVYPNPVTNFVNINFPATWVGKDANIEIINNNGQRVNKMLLWDLMQVFRIRVDNLPNGTYHLKISLQGHEPEVRTIQILK
jgi:hypothetical protein